MSNIEESYNIILERLGSLPIKPITYKSTLELFEGDLEKSLEFLVSCRILTAEQSEYCLTGVDRTGDTEKALSKLLSRIKNNSKFFAGSWFWQSSVVPEIDEFTEVLIKLLETIDIACLSIEVGDWVGETLIIHPFASYPTNPDDLVLCVLERRSAIIVYSGEVTLGSPVLSISSGNLFEKLQKQIALRKKEL